MANAPILYSVKTGLSLSAPFFTKQKLNESWESGGQEYGV